MANETEKFNRDLRHELAGLELDGSNIESYYNKRLGEFILYNSELTLTQKIEASFMMISGPLSEGATEDFEGRYPDREDDKPLTPEITLKVALLERTFVQEQIVKSRSYIKKKHINGANRQKVNFWLDYLKQRGKVFKTIQPKVPEWTQPLIALFFYYKGINPSEATIPEYCKQLGYDKAGKDIMGLYREYKIAQNRTFSNMELGSEKGKANAQRKRLTDLRVIMEAMSEKNTAPYYQLLADIEQLDKNLEYKI